MKKVSAASLQETISIHASNITRFLFRSITYESLRKNVLGNLNNLISPIRSDMSLRNHNFHTTHVIAVSVMLSS